MAAQLLLGMAAVVAIALGRENPSNLPAWVHALQMVGFGGTAVALLLGGRGDARVSALAAALGLIGCSFARVPSEVFSGAAHGSLVVATLAAIRVDAYLPLFSWMFFRDFPRSVSSPRATRAARLAIGVCATAGTLLIAANLLLQLTDLRSPLLSAFDTRNLASHYWSVVYGLLLPVFPFAALNTRRAQAQERRRAAILAVGTALAATPVVIYVVAMGVWPAFADWYVGGGRRLIDPMLQLLIVSIPLTTGYAVLVDRALPVRVLVQQAAQHGLARGLVTAGALLPFVWIVWTLHSRRTETLAQTLSGVQGLVLGAAALVGWGAFRLRATAAGVIDRTFFREQYDARQILRTVAGESRRSQRVSELTSLLESEIDRALHLERVAAMVMDPLSGRLRSSDGRVRPHLPSAALRDALASADGPVGVELGGLSEDDRYWLADSAAQLLVPMVSSAGDLIGVILLSAKRSELPFSGEDTELLAAIAAAGEVTLERRLRVGTDAAALQIGADAGASENGLACESCGSIFEAGQLECPDCALELQPIALPRVLNGKFALEAQIGGGGMGVVYRARDLELGRPVAIKTLPRTEPEEATRLRREARAMAAVQHPNLIVIYSAETWKGTPVLITEYLARGTLADRSRVALSDAGALGNQLCAGLERIHAAGILHRDIKPSNIGFSGDDVPKLLDFGLAQVAAVAESQGLHGAEPSMATARLTRTDAAIVGTPLYMSPEAIRGERADISFDLWALAIVLYESISGRHPFERATWPDTLRAIRDADLTDFARDCPEAPPSLLAFFRLALHADRRRRPQSTAEFRTSFQVALGPLSGEASDTHP